MPQAIALITSSPEMMLPIFLMGELVMTFSMGALATTP
jgi:hypothetical protein